MTRPAFKAQKPIDPELPKDAVQRAVDQAGGAPRAAIKAGVSPATIYAYCDPGARDEIPYARVCALSSPKVTAFAEHQALLAGGVFVPVVPPNAGELGVLTAEAIKQHAEAVARLVEALNDGKLTEAERPAAVRELREAIAAHVHLLTAISTTKGEGGG